MSYYVCLTMSHRSLIVFMVAILCVLCVLLWLFQVFLAQQYHAHHCHQQEHGNDLEREQILGEQQPPERDGRALRFLRRHRSEWRIGISQCLEKYEENGPDRNH